MAVLLDFNGKRPVVEVADDPPRVEFVQADGSSESFPYADLKSVQYRPAGEVHLRFTSGTVAIRGRCLLSAWSALRSRKAKRLRVCPQETEGSPGADGEPHIAAITVTPV